MLKNMGIGSAELLILLVIVGGVIWKWRLLKSILEGFFSGRGDRF